MDRRKPLNRFPYKAKDGPDYHLVWTNAADKFRPVQINRRWILRIDTWHMVRGDIQSAWRKAHPRAKSPLYPREISGRWSETRRR